MLDAAGKQVSRWSALLNAVAPAVASGEFAMPSYVEPEREKLLVHPEWNQSLQEETLESYIEAAAKAACRSIGSLSESELAILQREYEEAQSYLKEPVTVVAEIVTEG